MRDCIVDDVPVFIFSQSSGLCSCGLGGLSVSACQCAVNSRSQQPSESEAFSSFRYWQQLVLDSVPDLLNSTAVEVGGVVDTEKTTSVVVASIADVDVTPVLQEPPLAESTESAPVDLPAIADSSSNNNNNSVATVPEVTHSSENVDSSCNGDIDTSSNDSGSNSKTPIEVDVNIVEVKDSSSEANCSSSSATDSRAAVNEEETVGEGGGESRHDNRPLGARRMMERRQQLRMANTMSASDGGLPAVEVATNISSTQVIGECLAGGGGTLMLVSGVLRGEP